MNHEVFLDVQSEIEKLGFLIVDNDFNRPWGGYLVIAENQAEKFAQHFFDRIDVEHLRIKDRLSPKVLIVNPRTRLSWQYHHRRAEIWQVYKGSVGVARSLDDAEGPTEVFYSGDQIRLAQGERHRLVGLDRYGVVAEIWQHTKDEPSDENDIVRVQDDYGRE